MTYQINFVNDTEINQKINNFNFYLKKKKF